MAIPVISDLPPAPTRSDGPDDFTPKADAMIGALQPLVLQINIATQWMAGQLTEAQAQAAAASAAATAAAASAAAASASKNAAAQSAIDATENGAAQVALAEEQVALAVNAKNAAEVAAVAAGAAAGLPEERVPYSVLQINPAGNVAWGDGLIDKTTAAPGQALMLGSGKVPKWDFPGQQIGDVLITARNPGALYLPADGSIRLQTAYPELFAKVGLVGGNVGVSWPEIDPAGGATVIDIAASTSGTVIVTFLNSAVVRRSTDRGQTWANVNLPASTSGRIETDNAGTWMVAGPATSVFRSTDDGQTWQTITVPSGVWGKPKYCGANVWLIGASSASTGQTLLRSTNNGASFVHNDYGVAASVVSIETNGKGLVLLQSSSLRKSTDYGATWSNGPTISGHFVSMHTDKNGTWIGNTSSSSNSPPQRSLDDGASFSTFTVTGYSGGFYWSFIAYGLIFLRIYSEVAAANKLYVYVGNGVFNLIPNSALVGGQSNGNFRIVDAGQGVLIGPSINAGKLVRSAPQFPYDTATQFATPLVTAPAGAAGYIKAKELA